MYLKYKKQKMHEKKSQNHSLEIKKKTVVEKVLFNETNKYEDNFYNFQLIN